MIFALPLAGRELHRLALRPRIHLLKMIFVGGVFSLVYLYYQSLYQVTTEQSGFLQVMGRGRDLFHFIFRVQHYSICLVLPLLMSGAVTQEKENGTLDVLLVTPIGPGGLMKQLFLSRAVPMLIFLFILLPLQAIAYSLGGVTVQDILQAIAALVISGLAVGAFSLAISSVAQTTLSAMLSVYLLGGFLWGIFCLPLTLFSARLKGREENALGAYVILSLFIISNLVLARVLLVKEHFYWKENIQSSVKKKILWLFEKLKLYSPDLRVLPNQDPLYWKEVERCWWGRRGLFITALLTMSMITCLCCLGLRSGSVTFLYQIHTIPQFTLVLWGAVFLVMTLCSIPVLALERDRKTLDVILTTPLSGREILSGKISGLRRLVWLLGLPLSVSFLFHLGLEEFGWQYYVTQVLLFFSLLPAVVWISIWVSIKTRSRTRASVVVVIGLLSWCCVLGVLTFLIPSMKAVFIPLNPLHVLYAQEMGWNQQNYLVWVCIAIFSLLSFTLRAWMLNNADRILGRF